MISKYSEFINEKLLNQILLESNVVFSKKFTNLISRMKDNKIANELLKISGKDHGVRYNYIDTTDVKDSVSFIPDAKADQLKSQKVETFKVINNGRYLTHSHKNDRIFELLGYEKEGRENWAPQYGTIGTVLKEAQSPVSSNVYVLFQEYVNDNPRLAVLNKLAIEPYQSEPMELWTSSRNKMKVGRLVRAILQSAGVTFTDKDIEDFTNGYKSTFDFESDVLKQFDIVKGSDIAKWYWYENYDGEDGTLQNSCMSHKDSSYFDIYVRNSQVSLVILYSDDGNISSSKYTSDKIKGRALLWECKINGKEAIFMDRIYTTDDSDVELFKKFAQSKGFFYKTVQTMDSDADITNGDVTISDPGIKVFADDVNFDYYPYMDTLCYLNTDDNIIYNYEAPDVDRECTNTDGTYDDV